jgi:hypothetical protein
MVSKISKQAAKIKARIVFRIRTINIMAHVLKPHFLCLNFQLPSVSSGLGPGCRSTMRKWSKLIIVMTCSKTIWTAYLETPIQGPLLLGHFYKTLKVVMMVGPY